MPAATDKRPAVTTLTARVLAILAGALLPLSFSPVSFWPAGILSLAGLSYILSGTRAAEAALRGWLFGIGMFGIGTSWVWVSIATYGNVSAVLAILITLLFILGMAILIALPCWLLQKFFITKNRPMLNALSLAAIWVLSEWFRTWFLTGFPWLFLGYAHISTPLGQFAPLTGVTGISFVVALSGAAVHQIAAHFRNPVIAIRQALPALLLWLVAFTLQLADISWSEPTGESLTVAVVHGTVPQEEKFDPLLDIEIVSRYDIQTDPVWGSDVIIWPETAIPMFHHQAETIIAYLTTKASNADSTLITGIFHRGENGEIHNSIMSVGNGGGMYHKKRLVPFGEYVPLRSLAGPILQLFDLPMSSISPGPEDQSGLSAGEGLGIGSAICYEVVYPGIVREGAKSADLLVTISNDTWFGSSWGPVQHLEMAAMRALENSRYMLRATNNGLSAIIDEKGRIKQISTQFDEDQVLSDTAELFSGHTPWTIWGIWPLLTISSVILLFSFAVQRRQYSD